VIDIEFSEVKHRVLSQDYIILGKQARETEVKIHFDSGNPVETKHRIETAIRAAAYGEHLYRGGVKGEDSTWEVKDDTAKIITSTGPA
jgi:hypothetical protein